MQNLLVLFNPYYQKDVIDLHIAVLKDRGAVGFGKIKSPLASLSSANEIDWKALASTSCSFPLQLFLTDYSSLFVAKVMNIKDDIDPSLAPSYYQDKGLNVEAWFVIVDIIELVHKDFEKIRDLFLANFTTPDYGNHTYAIYGNSYRYPLRIAMKNEIDYFASDELFYPNIYKSQEFLNTKNNLLSYVFGEAGYHLHPESLENLVFAEMEFEKNKEDKLYDFSGVAIKYGKAVEMEAYLFFKILFFFLAKDDGEILEILFEVQGRKYSVADLGEFRPNLGTYKFLLHNPLISQGIENNNLKWMISGIFRNLSIVQKIRNEAAHGEKTSFEGICKLRNSVLGIGKNRVIFDFLDGRLALSET
ncbi:HP0729 family protein [Helicobacter pametensis]|uniref:HP0729 family protein n=1 Tax=Helicobacter pametensis TaxID=95149 RepID=UPI0004AF4B35|nr:HP0729 family protein [Helicobacter pametensis]